MPIDEIVELQKEWRAIVLDKLTSVEQGQKELKSDVVDIKTTFVKQQALDLLRESNRTDLKDLSDKVDKLVSFKYKLVGIFLGVQGLLFVIAWFLSHSTSIP
jgi:hypothetical protein